MTIFNLIDTLIEKESFELRILYKTSCNRLYTGSAADAIPPELLNDEIKSWTTFWIVGEPRGEKPWYVLQVETYKNK
jgi:hypothetical protein